jgi:hypothetical protein
MDSCCGRRVGLGVALLCLGESIRWRLTQEIEGGSSSLPKWPLPDAGFALIKATATSRSRDSPPPPPPPPAATLVVVQASSSSPPRPWTQQREQQRQPIKEAAESSSRRRLSTPSPSPRGRQCFVGAAERGAAARASFAHVAHWESHGNACAGAGRGCHGLTHVALAASRLAPRPRNATAAATASGSGGGGSSGALPCVARQRCCAYPPCLPRVYVYDCMDAAHAALLREPHVAPFFDPNLQRNQYLSEFALHRSLLAYSRRVVSPADADFFFVPFYARLAYADKVATKRVRRLQKNLTGTLARCLAH